METISEILPKLKEFNSILVSGPQRSGTTVAAHIIAKELEYAYVDEQEIDIASARWAIQHMKRGKVVIQCPALCYVADQLPQMLNYAVVIMRRDIKDIQASEERIHFWTDPNLRAGMQQELERYFSRFKIRINRDIAPKKYELWDKFQKKNCTSFDLDYESLKGNPLWVEKEQRQIFAPRQWQV